MRYYAFALGTVRTVPETFCFRAVRPCVRECSYTNKFVTRYLTNCLWKFHQIYNFGAVFRKDKLIRFLRSKHQRLQRDHTRSNKHFERHFLAYFQNAWICFHKTYRNYLYQLHMTMMTFLRSWVQRSRLQTTFSQNALFRRRRTEVGHTDRRLPSKTTQFIQIHASYLNPICCAYVGQQPRLRLVVLHRDSKKRVPP